MGAGLNVCAAPEYLQLQEMTEIPLFHLPISTFTIPMQAAPFYRLSSCNVIFDLGFAQKNLLIHARVANCAFYRRF